MNFTRESVRLRYIFWDTHTKFKHFCLRTANANNKTKQPIHVHTHTHTSYRKVINILE
jgi:predicted metal-dependent phosphotriesterase family hydrolase